MIEYSIRQCRIAIIYRNLLGYIWAYVCVICLKQRLFIICYILLILLKRRYTIDGEWILLAVVCINIFNFLVVCADLQANICRLGPNTRKILLIRNQILNLLHSRHCNSSWRDIVRLRELAWKVWKLFLESIIVSYNVLGAHRASLCEGLSWSQTCLRYFLIEIVS